MVSRTERGPIAEWWWTIDRWFLGAFLLLMGLGVVLSFAASPSVAERIGAPTYHFVTRQILFMFPGVLAMIAVSFLSPRNIRRFALAMLILSLVFMVVVLFMGIEVKGSRRWISIIAIILLGLVVALLVPEPDLGQTMLITATWGAMFFLAGMSWLWIIGLGAAGAGGAVVAYTIFPHVARRVNGFMTGQGDTFQADMGLEAIINGGWFGKGPGEGTVKRILPDSHTDYVFAVAAEEFGIIVCVFILAIFAYVVIRGLRIALAETDDFSRLAISGLVILFGFQSIINIGVNLQLLPPKGMTLPFISYGGSSLVATAISMGMVLALSRRSPDKRTRMLFGGAAREAAFAD
jgi:cell division protein FtsW